MPEPSVDEDELLDTPLPGLLDICANLLTEVGHPVYPPRHATPRLASPRLATPHLVTLGHATPSHAVPRHASPRHRVSSTRLGILYIPKLTLLDEHVRKKGNQRVHAPGSDQHVDPDVKGTAASACVRQRRCARAHPPIIPGGSRASSHHPWRFPCEQRPYDPDGIDAVIPGRQAVEQRVVSQDLELWLTNVVVADGCVPATPNLPLIPHPRLQAHSAQTLKLYGLHPETFKPQPFTREL